MLKLSDSRNFSRTLAAIGLVAGPLLLLFDALIDPAWDRESAAYLAEVSGNRSAYVAGEVAATVGSLLFIAGTIGVMHLMRGRRVTFGYLAAGLLTFGLIGLTASLAFNAFELAMADFDDRKAMVVFRAELQHSGAYDAYGYAFFLGGIVLGSGLLAIALLRRRIVPVWSPTLLAVAVVLWSVTGAEQSWTALSLVILAASLAPVALRMWSLGDEEWEQWELPIEGRASRPRRVPAAERAH
jgi:hypothetical protein